MGDWEIAVVTHLRSLADTARSFYEEGKRDKRYGNGTIGSIEEAFETELVRAEDFLEEVVGDADLRI